MADIVTDYLAGREALHPFFQAMPSSLLAGAPKPANWQADLVADMNAYQREIRGRGVVRGDEVPIVTGQQAGLLTGPLYTIYKALTAIRLAQELEARHRVPHVPVFWVHDDDHDFDEVAATWIVTKRNTLRELRYRPDADIDARPIHSVPLESSLHALIDAAATATKGSEFRDTIRAFLHESLDAAVSYSDWMARIMARLFQGTSLVVFTPTLPAARRLAAPVFAREIESPAESSALAQNAETALRALGYDAQVIKRSDECAFFIIEDGRRRKVELRDGRFYMPETRAMLTADELRHTLSERPDRFSANVLLRGVVQQTLFRPTAYVAGPGEIAYWAQLRANFERHDLSMPVVYPRVRATLMTKKLRKLCTEFGIAPDDVLGNPDTLRECVLRRSVDSPEMQYLRDHRSGVETAAAALAHGLAALDPSAGDMADALARAARAQLDRMERVLSRQQDVQREAIEQRLERLRVNLAPHRKHQERVLNVFSYLFSYGWELIPRLLQEVDIHSFAIQEIEL